MVQECLLFQYVENVSGWSGGCEVQGVSSDITVLETSIHHHQALYEAMCQAYTEVIIYWCIRLNDLLFQFNLLTFIMYLFGSVVHS